uniref:UPAR/Ly6 domain-containing protein n=1 Tax=Ciona savignyi TaxID=51511 RepID=H2Z8D1_CIOSA
MSKFRLILILVSFGQLTLSQGPTCYACAGSTCNQPRIKSQHKSINCGVGYVCWTIGTIEDETQKKVNYFRGLWTRRY